MGTLIDTAVTGLSNGKYYFFRDKQYVCYDGGTGIEPGYPKSIDGWNSLLTDFPGPYDAAFHRSGSTNEYYFFRGSRYVRYTSGAGVDSEFKVGGNKNGKSIESEWHDLWAKFPGPYDAAVVGTENGKYYFFKGDKYVRYTGGDGIDDGYAVKQSDGTYKHKTINSGWNNIYSAFPEPGPFDAVIAAPDEENDGKYYFFKGDQYARYTRDTGIDSGYPKSTRYMWPGLWTLGDYLGPALGPVRYGAATGEPTLWLWLRENITVDKINILGKAGLTLFERSTSSLELSEDLLKKVPKLPGYIKVYGIRGISSNETKPFKITLYTDKFTTDEFWITPKPPINSTETVNIVFGSCLDDSRQNPRLNKIPSLEAIIKKFDEGIAYPNNPQNWIPDFMIWGGDTIYYVGTDTDTGKLSSTQKSEVEARDMKDGWHMLMRQLTTRVHPSVASLMKKISSISTWDDHDFGFDDANQVNMSTKRKLATDIFRLLWDNNYIYKPSETDNAESTIEHAFRWGGVQVFVPDCRTHRNPPEQILSDDQRTRLINSMETSDAPVKIVVCGSQLIPQRDNAKGEESAGFYYDANDGMYPTQRTQILNDLSDSSRIQGLVLILSGDVHFSELTSYAGRDRTLRELTSTPLLLKDAEYWTKGLPRPPVPTHDDGNSRIWSVSGEGFARIKIDFSSGIEYPHITVECYTATGALAKTYEDSTINASQTWNKFGKI